MILSMEPYMYSMFRMKYKNFKKKFQLGVFRGGADLPPPVLVNILNMPVPIGLIKQPYSKERKWFNLHVKSNGCKKYITR